MVHNRASMSKSPSTTNGFQPPSERFSLEFMQLYDKDFTETPTNSYASLHTSNELSRWLDDGEAFEQVAPGKTQHDIYMRWDQPWQRLEGMSPGVAYHRDIDTSITAHGRHPVYCYLTAERDAGKGAFLGELTGQIAIKSEYEESSKMFSILKHPEPFVFFNDKLPICIDARNEGNKFRFIRRSCHPNSKMQIVIAGKEYRHCLVSDEQIAEGEEITLPWYIDPKVMEILAAQAKQIPISAEDHEYRTKWITGIFAHFGICACRQGDNCLMSLAKTARAPAPETISQAPKAARKKGKKLGAHVSPLSTGRATNSRANSVTVNRSGLDEDIVDSPPSGSGPSKPSSRDISPLASGTEQPIGLGVDLSEREKRKIQEQERLFARLEQDGPRKKKRTSGGSTMNSNTANIDAMSPPGSNRHDTSAKSIQEPVKSAGISTPSPPIAAIASTTARSNGRTLPESKPRPDQTGRNATLSKSTSTISRTYSESSTQTEEEEVDAHLLEQRRALGCNYAQRLLIRTRKMKTRTFSSSMSPAIDSPTPDSTRASLASDSPSKMDLDPAPRLEPMKHMPPPPLPLHKVREMRISKPSPSIASPIEVIETVNLRLGDAPIDEEPSHTVSQLSSHTKVKEPVSMSMAQSSETSISSESHRSAPSVAASLEENKNEQIISPKSNLTVEVPAPTLAAKPVQLNTESSKSPSLVTNTEPTLTAADSLKAERSPTMSKATLTSFTSSGSDMAAPSSTPIRKKMSLSDWTNRNKKKKIEASQAHMSPLATVSLQLGSDDVVMQSPEEEKKFDMLANPSGLTMSMSDKTNGDLPRGHEVTARENSHRSLISPVNSDSDQTELPNNLAIPPSMEMSTQSVTANHVQSISQAVSTS